MDGGPSLTAVVEVVWVDALPGGAPARSEVGLRFLAVDEQARAAIASIL